MGKSAQMEIQQNNGKGSKRGWGTIKKPWESSLRAERLMTNREELGYSINVNAIFVLLGLLMSYFIVNVIMA